MFDGSKVDEPTMVGAAETAVFGVITEEELHFFRGLRLLLATASFEVQ